VRPGSEIFEVQVLGRVRIDRLLVERGLVASRERAQALILAGRVLVNEQKVEKAGTAVDVDCLLRLLGDPMPYVSRGGLKLEHALAHWKIDVRGCLCLDVGSSTGGFTDCLLQHGAALVVAVDTGYGQIDAGLRTDRRVRLLEKTNARYLQPESVPERIEVLVMDVSFISATLVLPAVVRAAFAGKGSDRQEAVVLVKPQFEAGRGQVGKGGIVRDPETQAAAVEKVRRAVAELGAMEVDVTESPILGAEGNHEYLLHCSFAVKI
jgi:23S rRNA (cytidine1920-2'-O)/16S rRNA (cytidine1409-2'-O)-methyltransferase